MTAKDVRRALRGRHPMRGLNGSGWVTLEEAFRVDFLALACHSQGRSGARRAVGATYPWVGYEIKVSRSDFRNEIRNPMKRAFAVEMTHEFFFATPAGLVEPEEIPDDCGLVYVLAKGQTRCVKPSPLTEARPLSSYETAIMLRHGINPGWLRSMDFRKQSMKWREADAKREVEEAAKERARVEGILAESLGHTVAIGQMWRARPGGRDQLWRGDRELLVVEIGEHSVKLDMGDEHSYQPRLPMGRFLLDYEPVRDGVVATRSTVNRESRVRVSVPE